MVLLIYHDAYVVSKKQRRPGPDRMGVVQPRQLLAHQVPLVKEQPVLFGELVQPEHHVAGEGRHVGHGVPQLR
jgi:hypothetical protein